MLLFLALARLAINSSFLSRLLSSSGAFGKKTKLITEELAKHLESKEG